MGGPAYANTSDGRVVVGFRARVQQWNRAARYAAVTALTVVNVLGLAHMRVRFEHAPAVDSPSFIAFGDGQTPCAVTFGGREGRWEMLAADPHAVVIRCTDGDVSPQPVAPGPPSWSGPWHNVGGWQYPIPGSSPLPTPIMRPGAAPVP